MNIDHLVTMANQIGTFFASYPDAREGRLEIANHLQRYWAPRMRRQLFQYIDTDNGAGLQPLVLQALLEHRREQMAPPPPGGDAG
jgi:formate dehydrogenase subunit delta